MSFSDPTPAHDPDSAHDSEPRLFTRASAAEPEDRPRRRGPGSLLKIGVAAAVLIPLLAAGGAIGGRHWLRRAATDALPQIDGSLAVPGLTSPVTVQRDAHGVPHLRAASMDDLVLAQGYTTAQDRLWQMDMIRRHAAGELAAILGSKLVAHDRTQRTLQIRASADRALAALPADQLHWLTLYAQGVNAAMETQRASGHLPVEFRVLHYEPAPWTPRDSLLVSLAMFEDLTNAFPQKLAREALSARLPAQLAADLYPVGSWRDHPPAAGVLDLTIEGPPIEEVPLDESQNLFARNQPVGDAIDRLRELHSSLGASCPTCTSGSNDWVVAGSRTASGKPLLSDDMHLHLGVPDTWYEIGLSGPDDFDVAGVSLPGVPFVVVGHNRHIAWGITYLFADVQDLYIEQTRGTGAATEFQTTDGAWQPVAHHPETIQVRGGKDVSLDVTATVHGGIETPILTPILPGESRGIALRWTAYDPALVPMPLFAVDSAHDWPSFTAAVSGFGGPAQNAVYADDQGHIGYHAIGRVPIRGPHQPAPAVIPADIAVPKIEPPIGKTILPSDESPLSPIGIGSNEPKPAVVPIGAPISSVPVQATAANEWSGYIPFDQMPQVFDPAGGVLATANARITPDDYPYRIADNWAAPYRNERIWHFLTAHNKLTATDMLALQNDVYSDFDHVLAQRFAYAIDHSAALAARPAREQKGLRQAADLLRKWNGRMDADAAAPAIVAAAHRALWQILLSTHVSGASPKDDLGELYLWNQKDYALEQIVAHTPARWLPPAFKTWDDLMASALDKGLNDAHAPSDLSTWRYGKVHPFEIEHPVFEASTWLRRLLGWPIGSGAHPLSGDHSTVKQVDRSFGPSERLTVDFANLDESTLNVVMGESGNPASPWFADQFPAWYKAATFKLPFSEQAVTAAATHNLTLTPR
ncbi:penicillin amidase [Granulicella rosea]|uniref:Penicillin amidase n=1 Tax=Granulicella rosea TaxID=474952 RepID=A0A239E244_9BACT|nr:penicillin acylase family protein [Granulicella rosea]SNS37944.1 penicillin amidase [Granulicella rosea]